MNYLKELNAFYDRLETNHLSTSAIALWHALMHINNKAGWVEEFAVAVSVLCAKTGVSDRTISKARNELKQKGFIDFRSRKGNRSATYKLASLCEEISVKVSDKKPLCEINARNRSDNHADKRADSSSDKRAALNKLNETKLNKTNTSSSSGPNLYDSFIHCFGRQPTPIQLDEINSYIDQDGMEVTLVILAFEKAGQTGANFAYACKILKNWAAAGVRTYQDAQNHQQKFEQQKQQRNNVQRFQKPIRQDNLPKWMRNKPQENSEPITEEEEKQLQEMMSGL